jgi:uncharacterized membrane protein
MAKIFQVTSKDTFSLAWYDRARILFIKRLAMMIQIILDKSKQSPVIISSRSDVNAIATQADVRASSIRTRMALSTYQQGLLLTVALMLLFVIILGAYAIMTHLTYGTYAEDMGIMDQVLWNTAHGHFWQETICNSVSDTNCLAGASRWAIHFEPTMLLLVPIYVVAPDPRTLQLIQIVGVALGALPAYWLGARRLSSAVGGVCIAALYLCMPILRSATLSDFHMVTLAAPTLMFALWYMEDRNDRGLFISLLLAIGMKEQIPLDVFMIGLWIAIGQRRWRCGIQVMLLAIAWLALALTVMHLASPLGVSPSTGRYDGVLGTLSKIPLLWQDTARRTYLLDLLANTGGICLLAPWVLVMAGPSILVNALSDYPNQYAGLYHYNADIAPFLVLATLEGVVVLLVLIRRITRRIEFIDPANILRSCMRPLFLCTVILFAITFAPAHSIAYSSINPNRLGAWPEITAHVQLAKHFLTQIPSTASVSAQAELVPHLSHRVDIYQFPDGIENAEYVFLDMEGDFYPETTQNTYIEAVRSILDMGQFTLIDAQDGYLLLRRLPSGIPAEAVHIPSQLCPSYLNDMSKLPGINAVMPIPCPQPRYPV